MTAMRTFRYVICDVFTEQKLAGNALAVFTDARGMDDRTMQAVAREMNLSETVFVLRPTQGGHARIRIFTPAHEVPFAGHPVLGAAFVLATPLQLASLRLETGSGLVDLQLQRDGHTLSFATMSQPLPTVSEFPQPERLFTALGVRGTRIPVTIYDNGIRHAFVVVDDPAQVAALRPSFSTLAEITEAGALSVCAGQGENWKTRMFAPALGVNEDPATGSAAGPLALHLARHGLIAFGQQIRIEQGAEINRPSVLYARAIGSTDKLDRIEVSGSAVIVARGEFVL
jgi:trans-2,3-dihydro-3-hydroxyanthranilate isomerase